MTYLRILRLIDTVLSWLMRRCDTTSRAWAELADWHGRISFRQIDYARRVRKASGWEPVQIVGPAITWTCPPAQPQTFTTTSGGNLVTYTGSYR